MGSGSEGLTSNFLSGGGEMGERIRNFNWEKTPLGNPNQWEQSLKTCVSIMLSSSQPIWIGWGTELIKLYNDPYISIAGGKHPRALGQPISVVWQEIWGNIEPMLAQAMTQKQGTYVESQLLIMERNGYPEETYYTFSYTPIPGDDGKAKGIFCANTDDTNRVLSERALETLKNIGKISYKGKNLSEIYEKTAAVLQQNDKDFPFALFYEIQGNKADQVAWAGNKEAYKAFPNDFDINHPEAHSRNICRTIRNKIPAIYFNKKRLDAPKGFWDISAENILHIPLVLSGKEMPSAVLTLGLNPYRKYDASFQSFIELLTDQVVQEMNNCVAMETEKKRNEALQELDRAKTVFFNNISHEFRTPLTLMLGPLEELLTDNHKKLSNEVLGNIKTTHRNAIRLLKLVNTLLDFSRITSGRQQARFAKVDIATFTREVASNFESIIQKAGLKFKMNISKIKDDVYVDKQMWEKIVLNLLSNAFKYTLEGSITLNLFEENSQLVFQVKDTGLGIPASEIPKMFERFHRVKINTGRSYEGTGIGLSLVRELVNFHNGTIAVSSVAMSANGPEMPGSTFTVSIPVGRAHISNEQIVHDNPALTSTISDLFMEEASALVETESQVKVGAGKLTDSEKDTILIADDNADMRAYLKSLLESEYVVETAKNGKEALQKIQKQQFSLVLSDVMMPVMDGIQLLREIKSNQHTARIPVILLSARAGEEAKIEGYEIGADDYLVKPFSSNELLARVRSQIKIIKLRDELEGNVRSFFMDAPACISILRGPEHVYELANENYLNLVDHREIIGKPIREALPEIGYSGIYEILDTVYESGEPYSAKELALNVKRKDGSLREFYFDFIYQPLRNTAGETIGIMVFALDVTEQVLLRKNTEANEKYLSNIISQVNAGIAQADMNGKFVDVNERFCEITGYSKQELLALNLTQITHPDDVPLNMRLFEKLKSEGKNYLLEKRYIRKDGVVIWVNMSVSLITGPMGEKIITGVCIDITEAKEHENRIRQLFLKEQQARKTIEAERKRIAERERRFRNIVEQAPDPILILKGENMILETANEPLLKVWNIDESAFGKPFLEILPEMKEQGFLQTLQEVYFNDKIIKGLETPAIYTARNGKKRTLYFNYVYQPYREDDGTISGVIVMATDVTRQVVAHRKIRESEKKYRQLVTDIPMALYSCLPTGEIMLYNQAAIDLWSRTPEAGVEKWTGAYKVYRADGTLLPPDKTPMAKAIIEGVIENAELIVEREDGTRRNVISFPQLLHDNEGKLTGAINLLQDITDEKKAITNNAMLAAIVQTSDDAIISKTPAGIVNSWNLAAEKMFGFTAEEMVGSSVFKIVPPEKFEEENFILSQISKGISIHHFETHRLLKGGSTIDISLTISPIKNESGEVIGASSIARDITEAKNAQALLQESEKRFRMLAESLPQLVWVSGQNNKLEFVSHNWQQFTGIDINNADEQWLSVVHPDDVAYFSTLREESFHNRTAYKTEVRLKSKSGEYRWFAATGEPVFENTNEIIKWVGAFTDINHLKKEQQRKDAFLSMASHELKTPVTTIKAYGEIAELLLAERNDEQLLSIQRKMSKQVNKLTTLITDLLDNIRVEKGKLIFTESHYDFNRMVEDTVDDMRKMNPANQIKFTRKQKVIVFGDVDKISQVVNNFITNAIKYAPGSYEIILNSATVNDGVQLSVKDFGIGIPSEDIPHIFEQFYRVNGESQSTFPGMGIGLYICAEIIKRQGGKVWVESELGKGSTFYLWVPFDHRKQPGVHEDDKLQPVSVNAN